MTRLVVALGLGMWIAGSSVAGEPTVYKVGIPKNAFRDVPPALVAFAGEPLRAIMKSQTGLDGEVLLADDALTVAKQIDEGKLQLGVFLGHEFAWAKGKYPNLEPLVCTVPRPREVDAVLLVHWDCKAAGLADMKGTKLAVAGNTRDHARLFLERQKVEHMAAEAFVSTLTTETVHDAIHKVIDGDADVALADGASWNYFQKLYPGPSQNLKVLAKSDVFPPAVVAFKKGALDETVVAGLREGLLTAHESSRAAKLMNLIRLDRFEDPPTGYDEMLKACRKAYPTPLAVK